MIPLHHRRPSLPTTRLLSNGAIFFLLMVFACSPKPPAETTADSTAVALDTTVVEEAVNTTSSLPVPDNGDWRRDLNYMIDVPKGSVTKKNIVLAIRIKDEEGFGHKVYTEPGSISESDVSYLFNQPIVFPLGDTVMFLSEGQQGMNGPCFATQIYYKVTYDNNTGWLPERDGVYTIAATDVTGEKYKFDGITDSLRLGMMNRSELSLYYHNEEYDYAAADNCRDVNVLFFYSDDKIYFIDGETDDDWYKPSFNTSITHMAMVNATLDDLAVTNEPNKVTFDFAANPHSAVTVVAENGRLKLKAQ